MIHSETFKPPPSLPGHTNSLELVMSLFRGSAVILLVAVAPLAAQTPDTPPVLQAPVTLTAADSAHYLALGQKYTRWFLTGNADSLVAVVHPSALEGLGGLEGVREAQGRVAERAGIETKVVEEKLTRRRGRLQFWHAGTFSEMTDDQFVIRFLLDENGMIVGAGLGPKAQTPPVD